MADYQTARVRMVDNQLRTNDVTDRRVLSAMGAIPREMFVPASKRPTAYIDDDVCVSPASEDTPARYLLKPHVLAKLLQLAEFETSDLALVVGCASGYSAAVIAQIAESVVGLEVSEKLASEASETISELGIDNVAVLSNKLTDGLKSEGPYDVIIVDGAVSQVPEALKEQLKDKGRLVVIRGQGLAGQAYLYRRSGEAISGVAAFNASAPTLPGTEQPSEFVF
ncbi:MAG: protein-L-isoaspartate O-methyltransferase [Stappiaceae bacterium]